MSENACLEPLLKRRSVRVYEDREVPMDLILKVLDIARWAPSARNAQPWEFVVVTDRKILEELSKIH
ncbi:MAG: nitroreductase, partial [Desulfurococcales archaeon ex4484_42]